MYITQILYYLGEILFYRISILTLIGKFFLLESYKNVDCAASLTFNILCEGFFILIVTLPLYYFLIFIDFFGREVGGSGLQFIISLYVVITQSILSAVVFYAIKYNNIFGPRKGPLPDEFSNFSVKRQNANDILKGKVYFSTSSCVQDLVDSNNLKNPKVNLNPNWITGFTDGDGSFMVSVIKSKDRALG